MAALDGIRVVDLSRYLSGPTLTMLLGDLGAEVIKVETLPVGDPARESGPFTGQESVYYMASNRNKRSVAINLRDPAGLDICLDLVDTADVFVQNFRPGTAEKMGLGAADLRARNPRLVYASISGFGSRPPGDALPGFDQTAQAMSGLMSVTGTPETGPLRVGIAVADSATGVFAAVGVLAALLERERTGQGTVVEASLMESMLSLMSYQAQKFLSLREVPKQDGNDHPIMFPQGTFRARDGSLTLACGNEKMWPGCVRCWTSRTWIPIINEAGVPACQRASGASSPTKRSLVTLRAPAATSGERSATAGTRGRGPDLEAGRLAPLLAPVTR